MLMSFEEIIQSTADCMLFIRISVNNLEGLNAIPENIVRACSLSTFKCFY
jgi:hypothetical protein